MKLNLVKVSGDVMHLYFEVSNYEFQFTPQFHGVYMAMTRKVW